MKKRIVECLLVLWILGLCACGEGADTLEVQAIQPEESKEEEREERQTYVSEMAECEPPERQASNLKAAVRCEEWFYMANFAVGGERTYICGSRQEPPVGGSLADDSYFIGVVEAPAEERESCRIRELPIEIPEGMRVLRMTADDMGNCHLLWVSKAEKSVNGQKMEAFTYEKSQIVTIDADGVLLRSIDTSELFAEKHSLMYCFAVDNAGCYYVEHGEEILRLTAEGKNSLEEKGSVQSVIRCKGQVYGIGRGRSGAVYCVCRGMDRVDRLARIEDGELTELLELPQVNALYPCVGEGTDTELILFYREGGIFTVDVTGREALAELRVEGHEMPITGQAIGGEGVLRDGRVCLYFADKENIKFYYVPVGR